MIGYLKRYPAGYIAGWAVGTGAAGPLPALVYIGHKAIETPFYIVLILPDIPGYAARFAYLLATV
jgi:hypothetical protein